MQPKANALRFKPNAGGRMLPIVLLVLLASTGCVRRQLTIRSNPAGAMVYVDNQQVGLTPCSVDFTYYGTRELRIVKSGYETLTVNQPIPTPWYQIPPLDFVTDNFAMQRIRDNRTVSFTLQPQIMRPVEQIIARGEELRARSKAGPVVPAAAEVAPSFTTPGVPATGSPFTSPGSALPPPPASVGPLPSGTPTLAPPPTVFPPPASPTTTPPPSNFRY